jgi:hypothetical protein
MKIETKEEIDEKMNDFLKSRKIVKVGSFKRYEITFGKDGVEVIDWSVTKYYYKDGHTDEALNGCTITIDRSVRKRVAKAIGEA